MRSDRPRRTAAALAVAALVGSVLLLGGPATAAQAAPPAAAPRPAQSAADSSQASADNSSGGSCRLYASSTSFGLLCNSAGPGKSLAQLMAGFLDPTKAFCWEDGDLPDGFIAPTVETGPGRWWLHTCLRFVDATVTQQNARLDYEFAYLPPGGERLLTAEQAAVIARVTGRGQIPYLQAQTSPISSPRVGQDITFALLCDATKADCSRAEQGEIETPRLRVGGVTMWGVLQKTRVRPLGAGRPAESACTGGGLALTAAELDRDAGPDPGVCRYTYDRSSNGGGNGINSDRYPAEVTAFWQVFFDDGSGAQTLGDPFEKITISQIRVTEVQTLVVSQPG